jgi:hypothetical protein
MLSQELQKIRPTLARYAARYHLSGPEKDALVEHTFLILANDPDALVDRPIEQAVAETMHRIFLSQNNFFLNVPAAAQNATA